MSIWSRSIVHVQLYHVFRNRYPTVLAHFSLGKRYSPLHYYDSILSMLEEGEQVDAVYLDDGQKSKEGKNLKKLFQIFYILWQTLLCVFCTDHGQ